MIRFSLSFCLALALPLVAHADWRASAKDCANVIAAQAHCASCAAQWPEISRCAAQREGEDPARTNACIARVNSESWGKPMYYDRVAAVFACLSK
jgi:hypothetical protein